MPTSQNGWPASPDRAAINVEPCTVTGVEFPGGIKAGPIAAILGHVAEQLHQRVEKLVNGWCWGWAYRDVRGTTGLSNHASGTAIDINAPRHPLGIRGTWTAAQAREIRRILSELDGTVRWGGDYTGRPDEMHFEINANAATVRAVATRLSKEDNMTVDELRRELNNIRYQDRDHPNIKRSLVGAVLQAEANASIARMELHGLRAAVDKLADAVAGDALTAAELKAAVHEAIEEGLVRVQVITTPEEV